MKIWKVMDKKYIYRKDKYKMMKNIFILSIVSMSFVLLVFSGCGNAKDENSNTSDGAGQSVAPSIASAVDFYTEVWDAFGEENKFSSVGGDAEHSTEGPGQFLLTEDNADSFKQLILVTDELYGMLENDAATLQHMMNINTFSSAVAKLKDSSKSSEFAEGYRDSIQEQRWMCGFPDKVVVISVGDYVVMAYGLEENIDNLVAACLAVEKQSRVLVDAPAVRE